MEPLKLFLVNVGNHTVNFPSVTPPLGTLSLAAYVRERFPMEVAVLDQRLDNNTLDDVVRRIVDFRADVVGLSAMTPFGYMLAPLTQRLRASLPKSLILLGGPHVSAFGEAALKGTQADAAVAGEGELVLEQILRAYREGAGLESVPSLMRRDKNGDVLSNPGCSPFVEDLDTLPFPAYDLIDTSAYWRNRSFSHLPPRPYVTLMTSRGCPYRCTYCHRIFGKKFRLQSAERILDEFEHHMRALHISEMEIADDIFNLDERRVIAFAELVHKRNLKIRIAFPNALRVDRLTDETIEALAGAGTYYSSCALESGSPRMQKHMKKNLDIPRFISNVAGLVKHKVVTNGFTMLGFPTETAEEMRETVDVACKSQLHAATFFTVTPFPNTELYDEVLAAHPEKLEGLSYDEQDYTGIKLNLSDEPDEVLFSIQRKAWQRFYFNPKRILRILRDYPQPSHLPKYLPMLALRLSKGLLGGN